MVDCYVLFFPGNRILQRLPKGLGFYLAGLFGEEKSTGMKCALIRSSHVWVRLQPWPRGCWGAPGRLI